MDSYLKTASNKTGRAILDIKTEDMHSNGPLSPVSRRTFSSVSDSDDDQPDQQTGSASTQRTRKPMRKRAKTQEEKEQRQQERIMRNRAAAQVSRERKREYVATLENERQELHQQVDHLNTENSALRSAVASMTQRLEAMERTLALFVPNGSVPSKTICETPIKQEGLALNLTQLATPPGTVRPIDLISVSSSSPVTGAFDQRNPAVIAHDQQRRSASFPLTISTRSPMYLQMQQIILIWTKVLWLSTSTIFATHIMNSISAHPTSLAKVSWLSQDHWRFAATGPTDARYLQTKEYLIDLDSEGEVADAWTKMKGDL